MVAYIILNIKS